MNTDRIFQFYGISYLLTSPNCCGFILSPLLRITLFHGCCNIRFLLFGLCWREDHWIAQYLTNLGFLLTGWMKNRWKLGLFPIINVIFHWIPNGFFPFFQYTVYGEGNCVIICVWCVRVSERVHARTETTVLHHAITLLLIPLRASHWIGSLLS